MNADHSSKKDTEQRESEPANSDAERQEIPGAREGFTRRGLVRGGVMLPVALLIAASPLAICSAAYADHMDHSDHTDYTDHTDHIDHDDHDDHADAFIDHVDESCS